MYLTTHQDVAQEMDFSRWIIFQMDVQYRSQSLVLVMKLMRQLPGLFANRSPFSSSGFAWTNSLECWEQTVRDFPVECLAAMSRYQYLRQCWGHTSRDFTRMSRGNVWLPILPAMFGQTSRDFTLEDHSQGFVSYTSQQTWMECPRIGKEQNKWHHCKILNYSDSFFL